MRFVSHCWRWPQRAGWRGGWRLRGIPTGGRHRLRRAGLLSSLALSGLLAGPVVGELRVAQAAGPFDKLNHIVVIFQENRSFDSLYGSFPGADGLANAGASMRQVDRNGVPYDTLPQPIDTNLTPPAPDPRFPAALPGRLSDQAMGEVTAALAAEQHRGTPTPKSRMGLLVIGWGGLTGLVAGEAVRVLRAGPAKHAVSETGRPTGAARSAA